jgi:hypothetical protein
LEKKDSKMKYGRKNHKTKDLEKIHEITKLDPKSK